MVLRAMPSKGALASGLSWAALRQWVRALGAVIQPVIGLGEEAVAFGLLLFGARCFPGVIGFLKHFEDVLVAALAQGGCGVGKLDVGSGGDAGGLPGGTAHAPVAVLLQGIEEGRAGAAARGAFYESDESLAYGRFPGGAAARWQRPCSANQRLSHFPIRPGAWPAPGSRPAAGPAPPAIGQPRSGR